MVENVVDDAWRDAAERRVAVNSFHRVRFAGRRLSVSEYRTVVTGQHILGNRRESKAHLHEVKCKDTDNMQQAKDKIRTT